MRTLIILAVIILGYVNAMGQQTVDLDKASQKLKKSDLPFKSCKMMAYTDQGRVSGQSFATPGSVPETQIAGRNGGNVRTFLV
ncbi:MAG: hypothetical protein ACLUOS_18165 [Odoribacter splanchnicus]